MQTIQLTNFCVLRARATISYERNSFAARRFLHIQEPSFTEPDNCLRGHASKHQGPIDSKIQSKYSRELKRSFRRNRRTLVCIVTIPSRDDCAFIAQALHDVAYLSGVIVKYDKKDLRILHNSNLRFKIYKVIID